MKSKKEETTTNLQYSVQIRNS